MLRCSSYSNDSGPTASPCRSVSKWIVSRDAPDPRDPEQVLHVLGLEEPGRDGLYQMPDLALEELGLLLVTRGLEAGELGECVHGRDVVVGGERAYGVPAASPLLDEA